MFGDGGMALDADACLTWGQRMDDTLWLIAWCVPPAAVVTGVGLFAGSAVQRERLRMAWVVSGSLALPTVVVLGMMAVLLTDRLDSAAQPEGDGLVMTWLLVLIALGVSYTVGLLVGRLRSPARLRVSVVAWLVLLVIASVAMLPIWIVLSSSI